MSEQKLQLPQEGKKVGSGILLSLISTGGSAYIYKTWVEALEIHRAVKVMSPDAEPDIRDRFQTEARINSKLIHPCIVQCFNFGTTSGGLPFLEMEYLNGQPLSNIIQKNGPLPLPVSLAIATGILDALSYAHTIKYTLYGQQHTGLIHRDLKPGNIIISSDGFVKLMDFGIARPVDTSLHTVADTVPGTVAYMSPEACAGGECDFRSDIYQFGLCLYEFITGRPTFPQSDLTSLLAAKTTNKFQPAESLVKSLDHRITPILSKCLQLDPKERYQSAHACLTDIRSLYISLCSDTVPNQLLLSFLEGQPVISKPNRKNVLKTTKTASVYLLCASVLFAAVLAVLQYGPWLISSLKHLSISLPNPGIQNQTAMPETVPDTSIDTQSVIPVLKPVLKSPNRPKPKPVPTRKTAIVIKKKDSPKETVLSPEDALFYIKQGKQNYEAGRFSDAFSSFQTALKMPSQKPRQEIVRSSLYWSAKCNSVLFKQGSIPTSNYTASWQSVLNTFPAGSPEHTEADKRLQEVKK
ncbi:MAG: serine/threonine protein kinase [Spirochaetia bacterium]